MELEEIKARVDGLRREVAGRGMMQAEIFAELVRIQRLLDDVADEPEDEPPVSLDDGFVVLPIARFAEFCKAEETLQETRFEPTDGEPDDKQATVDALTRRVDELAESNLKWARGYAELAHYVREQRDEIGRLNGAAKIRAEAAAPPRTAEAVEEMSRRVDHLIHKTDELSNTDGAFLRHIQDFQAEVDAIKDRLDEGCGEFNKIKSRLDQIGAVGLQLQMLRGKVDELTPSFDAKLGAHWDRINALVARLNRLDADVMPIRRIGPLREPILGPEARRKVDEAKERLLEEAGRATGAVESTKP